MKELTSQQVGRCGELLVQYHLLKEGIESAPMTTDSGIDLVAFSSGVAAAKPITIQVKTSRHRSDQTSAWVLWEVPGDCHTDYVAIVDLDRNKAWMLPTQEFLQKGTKAGSNRRLLWSVDSRWKSPHAEADFQRYEIDSIAGSLFGNPAQG